MALKLIALGLAVPGKAAFTAAESEQNLLCHATA
jgi:hypothetical protein